MNYPEVLPREATNARWYETMSKRSRLRAQTRLHDAVELTVDEVFGKIALPNKIFYGFHASDSHAAAVSRTICVGRSVEKYLSLRRTPRALMGLIAHEISHISDNATNNWSLAGDNFVHNVVEEGKADSLGVEVGGGSYLYGYCRRINKDLRPLAYKTIGSGKSKLPDSVHLKRLGNTYAIGYSLVSDIIALQGVDSVCEIHANPASFYFNQAAELARIYETATR